MPTFPFAQQLERSPSRDIFHCSDIANDRESGIERLGEFKTRYSVLPLMCGTHRTWSVELCDRPG